MENKMARTGRPCTPISDEQVLEIVDKYVNKKYNSTELGIEYKVSASKIKSLLHKNGVEMRSPSEANRRYTFNEHYFDVIDNEHKAYWLGFLYADGCNHAAKNAINLGLQEGDLEILEKFKVDLESNRPIAYHHYKSEDMNRQPTYTLSVISKHMSDQLTKLGCMPRKSLILQFPTEDQVPKHLLRHWLRGMWDGDGSCSLGCDKITYHMTTSANLCSTVMVCEKVQELLIKELDIKSYIHRRAGRDNTNRQVLFGGGRNIFKFFSWLYSDSTIYLKRKYVKFLKMIDIMVSREMIEYDGRFNETPGSKNQTANPSILVNSFSE